MKTITIKSRFWSVMLLACTLFAHNNPALAQDDVEETVAMPASQSFSFVYIAQDATMNIQEIEKKLQTAWNRGVMEGPTIFYLSRGMDDPIVVKVNVEGDDNRADYESKLLPSINQDIAYSVDGVRDKQGILDLLGMYNFLSEDGMPLYKETNFDFHVGQDFWTAGNNEAVLAALFFELDIKKHIADEFHFNVFCPRTVTYNEDEGPFGILNPDDSRRYVNMDRSY